MYPGIKVLSKSHMQAMMFCKKRGWDILFDFEFWPALARLLHINSTKAERFRSCYLCRRSIETGLGQGLRISDLFNG
jgi:hypothetical protein